MKQIDIKDFFTNDYVDQASYDNLRKIASCVDGLKNSSRKVIHTVLDKNIKDLLKVQQLSSKAAEYTDYLHGSLDGVVVTLGEDYPGSNNLPLLKKKGNFGTRFIPEASASRYIFARAADYLDSIYLKVDRNILIHQNFEGTPIEPRFFVPVLPMLLVNGNRGLSSGFSQLILPRNPTIIKEFLIKRLEGQISNFDDFNQVKPYFKDFEGEFKSDLENPFKWIQTGKIELKDSKTAIIHEVPLGTTLKDMLDRLDTLKESGKIKKFEDLCDNDKFKFVVHLKEPSNEEDLMSILKLKTSITENFTSLGADNKIKEFTKVSEILEYYYQVKMKFLERRKESLLKEMENSILIKNNQKRFIQQVIKKEINLQELKTQELNELLESLEYSKVDNSFRYLTLLPLSSMQRDKIEDLNNEINRLTGDFNNLTSTTTNEMWIQDLKNLKI